MDMGFAAGDLGGGSGHFDAAEQAGARPQPRRTGGS